MSMNDKERMANDARMNDRFNRGLARKARKGDYGAARLLGEIQGGRLDLTGSFGIRNANQDRDLNIGQNRVDQKNQGVWADQGAGDLPEPAQAPKAAEPQRQVNPNSKLGAGNGTSLQGRDSRGQPIQNPGPPAVRAELGNGTLAEQQEAIDNPSRAPSATGGATTPAARQEESANSGQSFQEIEDAGRARSTASGAFGKVDKDGKLIKTDYAKVAQDAFKEDISKSALLKTGFDYEAGKAPEEVKAAQAKALERGLSLGGNREQLQAMIGMETDSAAIERKAGEVAVKDKTDSASRIAKIEAGLKKTGDKAANDYLADNRDAFESIDSSISKAKEIRDRVGKDEDGKALYSASDREALVINEAEQKEKLALIREKQAAGSRDRETGNLAADEIIKARKEITDNPFNGFSGRNNDGDWINDPAQGIMPDQKFLRENAGNPEAIKGKIRINIGNRQAVGTAFNAKLGGASKKAIVSLSAEEKSNSKNPFQTGKEVRFETDGFGKVKRQALDSTARYSEKLESIDKILAAASKTGYPIWQDKELMADPNFKKKAFANPALKKKIELHQEQTKQSEKTREVVGKASSVVQKVKDQDTWFNG